MNAEFSSPQFCPLCGQANECATEIERVTGEPQPDCWCMQATFPPSLLARVPEQIRGTACICKQCVEKAQHANA